MTANVLEHRRARAFADAVEERPGTTGAGGPQADRNTGMLAAVEALRAERGRLLLDQASKRMTEAQQLTSHSGAGQALSPHVLDEVSRALTDMNTEGSQGRDLLKAIYAHSHQLAPMRQLAEFADSQQQR